MANSNSEKLQRKAERIKAANGGSTRNVRLGVPLQQKGANAGQPCIFECTSPNQKNRCNVKLVIMNDLANPELEGSVITDPACRYVPAKNADGTPKLDDQGRRQHYDTINVSTETANKIIDAMNRGGGAIRASLYLDDSRGAFMPNIGTIQPDPIPVNWDLHRQNTDIARTKAKEARDVEKQQRESERMQKQMAMQPGMAQAGAQAYAPVQQAPKPVPKLATYRPNAAAQDMTQQGVAPQAGADGQYGYGG